MGMQRQGEGRTPWAAPGTGGGDFLQRPPMQPQGMQMPQPMNMQRPMINSGAMSQRPGLPQQQDPFATQNYLNQAGFGQNLG
jgi:hypothetical protein